ncbi:MAG: SDR family NAD(P)-dependent oxidoreductase [Bacteroidota bacterium]
MNKQILITGSTDGIGKLAAIQLAKLGHQVYLHGRNPEKLAAAISDVKAASQNEAVNGFIADLSNLNAVQQMAEEIKSKVSKLDVLINNAGVFNSPVNQAANGLDIRVVVNYLAPYLLTKELLPLLKAASNARIVNLSSAAQAPVDYQIFDGQVSGNAQQVYAQSKLALTMWSIGLAQQLEGISVVPVNPGSLLNTKMVQEAYGRFWSAADKGANILSELAIDPMHEGITGKYFDNDLGNPKGAFAPAHPNATDEDLIEELLDWTNTTLTALT